MSVAVKQREQQRKQQRGGLLKSSEQSSAATPQAPGEPMSFSVPEKLLRLCLRGSENAQIASSTTSTKKPLSAAASLFLRGGGTYICDYRNGAADVKEFFAQLGWTQSPAPCPSLMCNFKNGCSPASRHCNCSCVANAVAALPDFTFYWGGLSSISFAMCHAASLSGGRPLLMNRIPWVALISNKSQLATTCIGHKHTSSSVCLQSHVPATFVIDRDTDRNSLPTLARRLLAMHPVWIVKPHNYAKGEGIQIAFKEDGEEVLLRHLMGDRWGSSKVIQCYMTDPMLLAKKKFDLRVFLLLVSTGEGLMAFYHQGYVRLALNDFLVFDKLRLDTHLTNQAVQAKQAGYEANKEDTIWTVQQMNAYLNSEPSGRFADDWTVNRLHPAIKNLVASLVEALIQRVHRESAERHQRFPCRNTFNLLGLDVLIDSTGKPWLIEANADPALSRQTRTLEHLLPSVTAEAFGLAAEIITRCWAAELNGSQDEVVTSFEKLEFLQNFHPIGYYGVGNR